MNGKDHYGIYLDVCYTKLLVLRYFIEKEKTKKKYEIDRNRSFVGDDDYIAFR